MELIIFDLDDTLYEEMCYVKAAFQNTAHYLAEKHRLSEQELTAQMEQLLETEGRGKIFDHICEKFNIQEDIGTLVSCYRSTRPKLFLYEDACELLEGLKSKYQSIHTGIITDGISEVQHRKLEALGLQELIEGIVVTDDLGAGFWKPHKRAYEKLLQDFHTEPSKAVYIGDNPKKDFIGAKELGIHTVRIRRERGYCRDLEPEPGYGAELEIHDLREIFKLLEEGWRLE